MALAGLAQAVCLQPGWAQTVGNAGTALLYQQTCSTCHDGGAGGAPRLTRAQEWAERLPRGRTALVQAAIRGVPNSPMQAKGGYTHLSDQQVQDLVDWMLAQIERAAPAASHGKVALARAPRAAEVATPASDQSAAELGERLALGLRQHLSQEAQKIERVDGSTWQVRGLGIKVQVLDGVVTLSGSVEHTPTVTQAEAWVRQQAGVRQVTNRLVSAAVFEWD